MPVSDEPWRLNPALDLRPDWGQRTATSDWSSLAILPAFFLHTGKNCAKTQSREVAQSRRARNSKKEGNHEWTRMHTNEDKLFVQAGFLCWTRSFCYGAQKFSAPLTLRVSARICFGWARRCGDDHYRLLARATGERPCGECATFPPAVDGMGTAADSTRSVRSRVPGRKMP